MEHLSADQSSEHPETVLFERLESIVQDPNLNRIIQKALALETSLNELIADNTIDFEELVRRAQQHVHHLERNWPIEKQTVSVTGEMIDYDQSTPEQSASIYVDEQLMISEGVEIYGKRHHGEDGDFYQMYTYLRFAIDTGDNRTTLLARPTDVHIKTMVQSPEHAKAILQECHPEVFAQIDERIKALYENDDPSELSTARIFADCIFEADPDEEFDDQLVRAAEKYINQYICFENELPSYVVATGNYYQEDADAQLAYLPKRNSRATHQALVQPYKIAFRKSREEGGLSVHVPTLECLLYAKERGVYPRVRQYPLYTIQDIVSVRDIPYRTIDQSKLGK